MFAGRLLSVLAHIALAGSALGHVSGNRERSSQLEVELAVPASGSVSELVARIKNVGNTDLNLLKFGTILDDKLPIQKVVIVDEAGEEVQAKAIHPSLDYDALQSKHFQLLKASESVEAIIDAAMVHSFDKSGTYSFAVEGLIPLAVAPSTKLSGPPAYVKSNTVSMYVEARKASFQDSRSIEERTNLDVAGCNGTKHEVITAALANCKGLALAAAADAKDPASARFAEYFKTNSSATRQTVVERLEAAAEECSTADSGVSRLFCYDYYGVCEIDGPLVAYTMYTFNTMVVCPLFYVRPPLPTGCHRQCHATTVIHEATHCGGVYSPMTQDYAYGYEECMALEPDWALLNADTYSLYANAVYLDC
ncbi:hypothetical protein DL764_009925 [Monosporascus ibericus]|uniref:Neutral protease 2 n=1 Tax=Monosporascus ibericus TaxID=155417 RepID=A0A4V1X8U5_9PEZI|nr:hypothetical protein DL764_009925 [Monosporascus ibericus]